MIRSSWFYHITVQINLSSAINMQWHSSIKSLTYCGLLLPLYKLMKLNGPKIKKLYFLSWWCTVVFGNFLHFTVQIYFPFITNMQWKGSIKSLPCWGLLLPFYELMKLGVLAIQWIPMDPKGSQMVLKSRSYFFDLDHVKLSLGIFFILSCLM